MTEVGDIPDAAIAAARSKMRPFVAPNDNTLRAAIAAAVDEMAKAPPVGDIPDEAVEAAARAIYERWVNFPACTASKSWEDRAKEMPASAEIFRGHARAGLAAAYPSLVAEMGRLREAWRDIEADPPAWQVLIIVGGWRDHVWFTAISHRGDLGGYRGYNHRNGPNWATHWRQLDEPAIPDPDAALSHLEDKTP